MISISPVIKKIQATAVQVYPPKPPPPLITDLQTSLTGNSHILPQTLAVGDFSATRSFLCIVEL